jgi:hypothetical protein
MDAPATTHGATTAPSNDNSSNLDATSSAGKRLQVLAAAAFVQWRSMPQERQGPVLAKQIGTYEKAARQFYVVVQLLMLLVQQLQGAPSQLRAAFLHSPAGSCVLQVLSEIAPELVSSMGPCVMEVLLDTGLQQAGAGRQHMPAAPGWANHWSHGRAVVELLLLPGLLLEPVLSMGVSEGANSSKPGGCSTASEQRQDAIKHSAAGSSSGGSGIPRASSSSGIMPGAVPSRALGATASIGSPRLVVALKGEDRNTLCCWILIVKQ